MIRLFLTHSNTERAVRYSEEAVAALRDMAEVSIHGGTKALTPEELTEAARDAQIIISDPHTAFPEIALAGLPKLMALLRCAVDIRNIDVEAASRQGILVTRATPGFAASVAEFAVGQMIELSRGIGANSATYRDGRVPEPVIGRQLMGSTLGIIGYGVIGEHLAKLGVALGMDVLVTDPYRVVQQDGVRQCDQAELLSSSDFVACLAPATAETENLMDAAAFALMKPTASFLNLARGELVDDRALADALDDSRIAAAALDVGRDPGQMPTRWLASHPKVLATPHVAGLTHQAVAHQAMETVAQTAAILRGETPKGAQNADNAMRFLRWRETQV
jgi:D-3-phosphoglycerate dehydrogenase